MICPTVGVTWSYCDKQWCRDGVTSSAMRTGSLKFYGIWAMAVSYCRIRAYSRGGPRNVHLVGWSGPMERIVALKIDLLNFHVYAALNRAGMGKWPPNRIPGTRLIGGPPSLRLFCRALRCHIAGIGYRNCMHLGFPVVCEAYHSMRALHLYTLPKQRSWRRTLKCNAMKRRLTYIE